MRWVKPQPLDIRTRKRFTLFPIEHNKTTYWLETVTVEECYECLGLNYFYVPIYKWVIKKVINE